MEENTKLTPQEEELMIRQAFQRLCDGYLASSHRRHIEIVNRAFEFANKAHAGVRRRSGEPYIMHPIAVATIVSQEIGLGSTSICAALLHDVVEDTDCTIEVIEASFGKKIATIVDGLTKIPGDIFSEQASVQAENFRKLLLTMSDDIRVVLIKLADRLHNMRTLSSMPPNKQYKIAGETIYIYAPLAHRLGLFSIKSELEDLSFKYEHPDVYASIVQKIAETAGEREKKFEQFAAPIRQQLDRRGLKYEFRARVKTCFSIWKKMESKHIPFEEVYDLYAARIVFECDGDDRQERDICWEIYSDISDIYTRHPDRLRDWITKPKANGYRALHMTVMGPDGTWVEVQIRSSRMDDIAEHGLAAHWKYKIGDQHEGDELKSWIRIIEDTLQTADTSSLDFLDTIKLNLFTHEIFVFTPKGELITLPVDASVLDMAYTLHTELGNHCIAGKVNHMLVPNSHRLVSGDQVEIITSQSAKPQPEWEKFLVTARGKTRLRAALRHQRREIIEKGENELRSWLLAKGEEPTPELLMRIIHNVEAQNKEDLLFKIGNKEIAVSDSLLQVSKESTTNIINKWLRNPFGNKEKKGDDDNDTNAKPAKIDTKKVYELRTEDGMSNYRLADCCRPIRGDDVVGIIDKDGHVVLHKQECERAMMIKSSHGSRLVQTRWASTGEKFRATVMVEGIDRQCILQEIIYAISTHMDISIRSLNIAANQGVFTCRLDVLVEDAKVLTNLCKRIKKVSGVDKAARVN